MIYFPCKFGRQIIVRRGCFLITKVLAILLTLSPFYLGWELYIDGKFGSSALALLLLLGLFIYYINNKLLTYDRILAELEDYRYLDFKRQKDWTGAKVEALIEGANKGHDLGRLADTLGQTEASVRGKLVKLGRYEKYLEKYVDEGAKKFAEWQKIQRRIGKIVPLAGVDCAEEKTADNPEIQKTDSELVKNLADNWFDPRIEFCERFFSTTEDDSPDVISQHEVIKHAAAFLNTARGYVLIGVGKQGRLEGLFEDDFRTPLHYRMRLFKTLRKALGDAAMQFLELKMVRLGSEDLCLIICRKSDEIVLCQHKEYNKLSGLSIRQRLTYVRVNAMTIAEEPLEKSEGSSYHA